ncbi:hypothetical protein B9Z55_028092 [Caenorhabditis nigoni]|uniref:Uncharacterized protein n=1 Tax=Caenorhabditis nigoni TaxID=1611254 RepID=A0A2G5SDB5_9PELO|nr:hypothetical protein B9Z55_028084 [Caenorhabditis nigoni]PIC13017.1 hypothetical protein B9Z55_028092 [Caenorhabditis nigoni]
MSHKFVACDAARERQNRAYAFASQQVFQHAMVHNAWATLDIEDETTSEYINCMKISELERKKFEADVLTNSVDPKIKFVKSEENLLPLVVSQRAPRGRGNFNQRFQQRNNNWTRRNFAQKQRFQQRDHFNYPMQKYFIGSSQTVPLMALQIPSGPSGFAPVHHGFHNTFSAAHGYSQSSQPNGGHFPSPTESGDSDVYTNSSSNGSVANQNIQQTSPSDVSHAPAVPPGFSQIDVAQQEPQVVNTETPIQTINGLELAEEKNKKTILQHHEEPQLVVEVKNSKEVGVTFPNGADDISGTSKKNTDLSCDLSMEDTSDEELTMKPVKSVLPTAPESSKFVEIAELPPTIETSVDLGLENESPIVPDHMSGAPKIDTSLNCELSKLEKPAQSMETTDFDTKELQETSDEATVAVFKISNFESSLPKELESTVAEKMPGASNTERNLSEIEKSSSLRTADVEVGKLEGQSSDEGASEPKIAKLLTPHASGLTEESEFPEFPELSVKTLDSAEKCSKNAGVPMVDNEKPSRPLMSEVLLAAIEKEKITVNPCLNTAPIVQRNFGQKKNKNLTNTDHIATKSQGSKAAQLSQIRNSGKQFHNKKPEALKNHLPAKQEQDSSSGWKTVKGSSKVSNKTQKISVFPEQPPFGNVSKKSQSSSQKKSSATVPSEKNNQEGSSIEKPDHPEKPQVSESNRKKPVKKQKKDKTTKTAKSSDIDDFDTLLEQFKEEDRKSAEKSGNVGDSLIETVSGNKKRRTIRQYQAERDEAERKEQEIFDSIEKDGKRLEVCVNMGLCQFFEELNQCVMNRSPMYNWPECPMRDLSESEEVTRERDELVFDFIHARIADQFERVGTTPILRELFYRFIGRHYNSNLGLILESLARVHMKREITFEDEEELFGRMLNKREFRAEWNVFNFHYPDASNE